MKAVNHDDTLNRAAAYIMAGCPEIEFVDGKQVVTSAPAETDQLLTVEADLAFKDRIKRGNYGWWTNSDLTEKKFPVTEDQHGEWEWKLFHFNRSTYSEEVIRLMKEDGYDAGQIGHILTFGEKYPEEQRKYPIIGLGSVAGVEYFTRRTPVLQCALWRRELYFGWFDDFWLDRDRFLGVRRR
jgi:hypothetical protein